MKNASHGSKRINLLGAQPQNYLAVLVAFERSPYFMAITYCANLGGLRQRPSTIGLSTFL
jgi:hypothetical protein